jgi:hypothetical protein
MHYVNSLQDVKQHSIESSALIHVPQNAQNSVVISTGKRSSLYVRKYAGKNEYIRMHKVFNIQGVHVMFSKDDYKGCYIIGADHEVSFYPMAGTLKTNAETNGKFALVDSPDGVGLCVRWSKEDYEKRVYISLKTGKPRTFKKGDRLTTVDCVAAEGDVAAAMELNKGGIFKGTLNERIIFKAVFGEKSKTEFRNNREVTQEISSESMLDFNKRLLSDRSNEEILGGWKRTDKGTTELEIGECNEKGYELKLIKEYRGKDIITGDDIILQQCRLDRPGRASYYRLIVGGYLNILQNYRGQYVEGREIFNKNGQYRHESTEENRSIEIFLRRYDKNGPVLSAFIKAKGMGGALFVRSEENDMTPVSTLAYVKGIAKLDPKGIEKILVVGDYRVEDYSAENNNYAIEADAVAYQRGKINDGVKFYASDLERVGKLSVYRGKEGGQYEGQRALLLNDRKTVKGQATNGSKLCLDLDGQNTGILVAKGQGGISLKIEEAFKYRSVQAIMSSNDGRAVLEKVGKEEEKEETVGNTDSIVSKETNDVEGVQDDAKKNKAGMFTKNKKLEERLLSKYYKSELNEKAEKGLRKHILDFDYTGLQYSVIRRAVGSKTGAKFEIIHITNNAPRESGQEYIDGYALRINGKTIYQLVGDESLEYKLHSREFSIRTRGEIFNAMHISFGEVGRFFARLTIADSKGKMGRVMVDMSSAVHVSIDDELDAFIIADINLKSRDGFKGIGVTEGSMFNSTGIYGIANASGVPYYIMGRGKNSGQKLLVLADYGQPGGSSNEIRYSVCKDFNTKKIGVVDYMELVDNKEELENNSEYAGTGYVRRIAMSEVDGGATFNWGDDRKEFDEEVFFTRESRIKDSKLYNMPQFKDITQ